jgi:transcriptional regulator with XRE-family HTH domain
VKIVNLYELRKHFGKTQEQVAEALGVSRPTYSKYESGQHEPSYDMLKRLAGLFGCSIDYLLGFDSYGIVAFLNNIRHYRDMSKESVETISRCIGVTVERYNDIEAGKVEPTITELVRLALFFYTTVNDLIGIDDWHISINGKETPLGEPLEAREVFMIKLFRRATDKQKDAFINMLEVTVGKSESESPDPPIGHAPASAG